jgi:cytochrome P450
MVVERPVAFDPEGGLWHFCGYAEVHAFLKDWEHWSTAKRMELIPVEERVIRLLTSEPPLHVALRKHFSHAYRPRRVASMEQHIRSVCRSLIAECVARRRFNFTSDLAAPLTIQLIAELIGIDPRDLASPGAAGTARLGPLVEDGQCPVLSMGGSDPYAHQQAGEFFAQLIAARRQDPRDDLVSDLARIPRGDMEGRLDVGALLVEQFGAGHSTTTHLLGSLLYLLSKNPDQLSLVREHRDLLPMAVEETVRLCGPLQARPRVAARPVEVAGGVIPEGSLGLCWMQSANLDPVRFRQPLQFDVTRQESHHVAFGFGEHHCLGANLARMEGRVFLEEFLVAVRDYRIVSPEPVALVDDFILRGPAGLEIEVTPAPPP